MARWKRIYVTGKLTRSSEIRENYRKIQGQVDTVSDTSHVQTLVRVTRNETTLLRHRTRSTSKQRINKKKRMDKYTKIKNRVAES